MNLLLSKSPLFLLSLLLLGAVGTMGVDLGPESFAEKSEGKSVFVMFRAPWCGHCKAMKPTWDDLEKEYADSKTALVGHVDCTVHTDFCGKKGVQGYPTIKYGDADDLADYQGGRELADLQKFAKESLKPSCGPRNTEVCNAEQKKKLEDTTNLSDEDLEAGIKGHEEALQKVDKDFETGVKELQEKYKGMMESKDAAATSVKEAGLGMLKKVRAHREKEKGGDL